MLGGVGGGPGGCKPFGVQSLGRGIGRVGLSDKEGAKTSITGAALGGGDLDEESLPPFGSWANWGVASLRGPVNTTFCQGMATATKLAAGVRLSLISDG